MGKVTIRKHGRSGRENYTVHLDGRGVYGPFDSKRTAEEYAERVRNDVRVYRSHGKESHGGYFF